MDIYGAYELLKQVKPHVNPTSGFEYNNLFIFDTGAITIGLPYAIDKETKKVFLFNPLHEKPDLLKSAFMKTKVDFMG